MLIGTSLSGCLVSILDGEVEEDQVAVIITGTDAPEKQRYLDVVREYHRYSTRHYDFSKHSFEATMELATRLWDAGKIHQPRVFGASNFKVSSTALQADTIWLDISPVYAGNNQSVIDAYEQYQIVAALAS